MYEALRAGASGFLLKDSYDLLATAVRVVAAGDALVDAGMTRRLIARFPRLEQAAGSAVQSAGIRLSCCPQESSRFSLGLTNHEICDRLVVSESTVRSHVSSVLAKLGLRDRVQAVILAYETGTVAPRRAAGAVVTSGRGGVPLIRTEGR